MRRRTVDPDAVLADLRELVHRVDDGLGRVDPEEFTEKFRSLDGWMSHGGYAPADWSR